MRFVIFGAGALGQALGCLLSQDGHSVDLLLRQRFIPAIEAQGLKVDGVLGEFSAKPGTLGLYDSVEKLPGHYDYALITTKSYDTDLAIKSLMPLQERIDCFVSLQNGCGNVEKLAAAFSPEKVLGGRVITGFEIIAPGTVRITVTADAVHLGDSIPGHVSQSALQLADIIRQAGHPAVAVEDVHQSLYAKLLYNCALNPLGAVLGVHYGLLGEQEETRNLIDAVLEESFAVVAALGGSLPWNSVEEYKKLFYETLLPVTYNHRPSMLQDLENGKQTEVDSLVGYVTKKGAELGVATPTCDMLTALIRFRQKMVTAQS
ncbi:ketopantoate reductase family protein [Desulfogranum japonicum]|uniref:ketopantoate reductase family protein n=1 Tax=Desulfogranum japonicum TaxID=231447 RepID=UPI0004136420|nr:ketopantoate reductase family protein [Desulfogranum japonicum]